MRTTSTGEKTNAMWDELLKGHIFRAATRLMLGEGQLATRGRGGSGGKGRAPPGVSGMLAGPLAYRVFAGGELYRNDTLIKPKAGLKATLTASGYAWEMR